MYSLKGVSKLKILAIIYVKGSRRFCCRNHSMHILPTSKFPSSSISHIVPVSAGLKFVALLLLLVVLVDVVVHLYSK